MSIVAYNYNSNILSKAFEHSCLEVSSQWVVDCPQNHKMNVIKFVQPCNYS